MATMRIFVSHSHEDDAFCHAIVAALRTADADVWYDEHDLGSGQLLDVIQRELKSRPVFIVILSPAAMKSTWVKDEAKWAYNLYKRDVTRTILPITAGTIQPNDFDDWLFIEDYKRIEAPNLKPYASDEAAKRLLRSLALTPRGEVPAPTAPQPQESAEDLIARGKALRDQNRYNEAVPLFQRATQLAPNSFNAWANLSHSLLILKRAQEGLHASEQAIRLNPSDRTGWNNKGAALNSLGRYSEALTANEQAITLDAHLVEAWIGKGLALYYLKRYQESLIAYEHVIAINPEYALAWHNKALSLRALGRNDEAQQADTRAKELGRQD